MSSPRMPTRSWSAMGASCSAENHPGNGTDTARFGISALAAREGRPGHPRARKVAPRATVAGDALHSPHHSALAPLDRATVWLNSEPLTADALRGRVVAVD